MNSVTVFFLFILFESFARVSILDQELTLIVAILNYFKMVWSLVLWMSINDVRSQIIENWAVYRSFVLHPTNHRLKLFPLHLPNEPMLILAVLELPTWFFMKTFFLKINLSQRKGFLISAFCFHPQKF